MTATNAHQISELLQQLANNNALSSQQAWVQATFDQETITLIKQLTHNDLEILTTLTEGEQTISQLVTTLKRSQGGISRRVQMMVKLALITKSHHATNRKTVYLSLTPQGARLAEFHRQLHHRLTTHFLTTVEQFTPREQVTIIQFLSTRVNPPASADQLKP